MDLKIRPTTDTFLAGLLAGGLVATLLLKLDDLLDWFGDLTRYALPCFLAFLVGALFWRILKAFVDRKIDHDGDGIPDWLEELKPDATPVEITEA